MSAAALTAAISLVVLAALLVTTTGRRRDTRVALSRETLRQDRGRSPYLEAPRPGRDVEREAARPARSPTAVTTLAPAATPAVHGSLDPETIGVTRRQFFNRTMVGMMLLGLSGFGGSVLAFLWPTLKGGFGSKVKVGELADLLQQIDQTRQPVYVAEARTWVSAYPKDALPNAKKTYAPSLVPGMEAGIVALYQKCPHLGCRVPFCQTSQWFECPCHGSQYNRVGEKKGGPAPRGMDRFPVTISGGSVTVDTGNVVLGPPIGTNTTGQETEGPHCVTGAGGRHQ